MCDKTSHQYAIDEIYMPLVKHLMKELCLNLDLQNKIVKKKKKLLIIEKSNNNKENLEMKKNNHNWKI